MGETISNNESNIPNENPQDKPNEDNDENDNPIITDGIYHSFTESGKTSTFFIINGNTSTSKGTTTYNGQSLSTCLKMESSTSIKFNTSTKMTLTLVFGGSTDANGKTVKINGTKYTVENNVLVIELEAGSYDITKGDSINLFYMKLE